MSRNADKISKMEKRATYKNQKMKDIPVTMKIIKNQ
jgi:hypothetical protein